MIIDKLFHLPPNSDLSFNNVSQNLGEFYYRFDFYWIWSNIN